MRVIFGMLNPILRSAMLFIPNGTFRHFDWKIEFYIIKMLVNNKGRTNNKCIALDVACGDGDRTSIFSVLIKEIVGIDIDLTRLRKAKAKGISVIQGDARRIPFRDDVFHLVLSFHFIEHVRLLDAVASINEMYRVLRKKGWLLLVTPNRKRLSSIINLIGNFLYKRGRRLYLLNPDHVHEYDIKEFLTLIKRSNFRRTSTWIIPMGFIKLPREIALIRVPNILSEYCNQILVLARK
ncbi:MAG: hypothetical protein DRN53_06305 [Thermoprotei archaeon]|nr:MAG: hypothetical protein DRN53_06305 [Thermoprotei archaeon]